MSDAKKIIKYLLCAGFLLAISGAHYACATAVPVTEDDYKPGSENSGSTEKRIIYPIIVQSPQEVMYSSNIQPFVYHYEGEEETEAVFYTSREDRMLDNFGTYINPQKAGTYFVSIRNRYEEVYAEYRIIKNPVKITAEENQKAYYDGDPKRVAVDIDSDISLSFSYYPNPALRDEAIKTAEKSAARGNPSQPQSEFKGYKRIDRAPSEQGTYYVWVYFPGDENHETVSLKLELTILPPKR